MATPNDSSPQKFLNGEIHHWYQFVMGYSDKLVGHLIDLFDLRSGQKVLDPFCGAGTTLVECMKRGIDSVGIDANPSSCFAAQVKTTWSLNRGRLQSLLEEVQKGQPKHLRRKKLYREDPTYVYLENSGMLERGWISTEPLRKAIALKQSILELRTTRIYRDALMLALIAEVIGGASNVKFGPEIYCGPVKTDADVFSGFAKRVQAMLADLEVAATLPKAKVSVIQGDSRQCNIVLRGTLAQRFAAVICSPPYPTEHDYTRNSRLELAFLEQVSDLESLRSIKRNMIRSHTKGIYKEDNDATFVAQNSAVNALVKDLNSRVAGKSDGFARLYPKVVQEYFGGMKRHFSSLKSLLGPESLCAYVVGDQSSYAQLHIPTAEILSLVAKEVGFETVEIKHWRSRRSTTTSNEIQENILILRKQDFRESQDAQNQS